MTLFTPSVAEGKVEAPNFTRIRDFDFAPLRSV
jgi:hypothetical protein